MAPDSVLPWILRHTTQLQQSGIKGVEVYEKKLMDNANDPRRLGDLVCEGRVARIFQNNGWAITMRESPDLEGRSNGIFLGIEVKHFRYKQKHDPLEDAALASSGEILGRIPHLHGTESDETAWDQMYRIAKKSANQYLDGEFNVLFFVSTTQAHCDATFDTAVNIYDEEVERPSCDQAMRNLTAMMILTRWGTVGYDHRSISCKPILHASKQRTEQLVTLFDQIREE